MTVWFTELADQQPRKGWVASGATSSGKRSGSRRTLSPRRLVHRAKRNKVQHDTPRTLQTENSEQIVNPHLPNQ